MNMVIEKGVVSRPPSFKYTESNHAVIRFTVAVRRRNQEGGHDYIPCIAWDKTAEFIYKYFPEGMPILVQGRIQTGSYTDKDGKKVYTTDVLVTGAEFAGNKKEDTGNPEVPDAARQQAPAAGGTQGGYQGQGRQSGRAAGDDYGYGGYREEVPFR